MKNRKNCNAIAMRLQGKVDSAEICVLDTRSVDPDPDQIFSFSIFIKYLYHKHKRK
jgi:hypothetical protein